MAKKLVVLSQTTNGIMQNYSVAFWFPITSTPRPQTNGSVWIASGTSTGASAAESAAIQAGTVVEEVQAFSFPVGLVTSAIQSYLVQFWTNRNVQINGVGGNQYFGTSFDGVTWSSS
jgi:hypothetical protein